MITGSTSTWHGARHWMIAALVVGVFAVGAGGWWVLARVLLAPPVPQADSPAEACVAFIADEHGLPRLARSQREAFLTVQLERLRGEAYREAFLGALRRSSPERKGAFQAHLFDVAKPYVMADAEKLDGIEDRVARTAFLDDCIVRYNRITRRFGTSRISRHDVAGALPTDPTEVWDMVVKNTSSRERELGQALAAAVGARVSEILADAALTEEMERRIAAP